MTGPIPARKAAAKSATPKKAAAKKAPAKKALAAKSPAKKSPAKKSPAKKSPAKKSPAKAGQNGWLLLVYKVPSEPSRMRVGVWRELKRLGALYLQQAVAVFPDQPGVADSLRPVRDRITETGGTYYFFRIEPLQSHNHQILVDGFRTISSKEYAEITEECETKFIKEIEFERFRANYTFEEAEEIRQDLEKIRRWFDRVVERDWFEAPGRAQVEEWLERCETELEAFESEVYDRTGGGQDAS